MLQTQRRSSSVRLHSNDPFWSLSLRRLFYLTFALAIGRFQDRFLKVGVVLAAVAVGLQLGWNPGVLSGHVVSMFAYSTIWLLGTICRPCEVVRADSAAVIALLGLVP